jgi:hypothetical protein
MGSAEEAGATGGTSEEEPGHGVVTGGGVREWVEDFLRGAPDADPEEVVRLRRVLLRLTV